VEWKPPGRLGPDRVDGQRRHRRARGDLGITLRRERVRADEEAAFIEAAEGARDNCPVSGALKGNVEILLDARLAS
jgi:organic hydroperoxide reductase OsmC/OhrA